MIKYIIRSNLVNLCKFANNQINHYLIAQKKQNRQYKGIIHQQVQKSILKRHQTDTISVKNNHSTDIYQMLKIQPKGTLLLKDLLNIHKKIKSIDPSHYLYNHHFVNQIILSIQKSVQSQVTAPRQLDQYIILMELSLVCGYVMQTGKTIKILQQGYLILFKETVLKKAESSDTIKMMSSKLKMVPYEYLQQIAFPLIQYAMLEVQYGEKIESKSQGGDGQVDSILRKDAVIELFRILGRLLNRSQLKQVDQWLFSYLQRKRLNKGHVIKATGIFNQLSLHGLVIEFIENHYLPSVIPSTIFTEEDSQLLNLDQTLKISLNLVQLGSVEHLILVQTLFINSITQSNKLSAQDQPRLIEKTTMFIQIMHQYKLGSKRLWITLEKYRSQMALKQRVYCADWVFPVVCGLYRNYLYDSELLLSFLQSDKQLSYTASFSPEQFVEFYLVLHENVMRIGEESLRKIWTSKIIQKLKISNQKTPKVNNRMVDSSAMASKFMSPTKKMHQYPTQQLRNFYLFIYSLQCANSDLITLAKSYLRRSKPTDSQLVLLSWHYSHQIGMVSKTQLQEYKDQLLIQIQHKTGEKPDEKWLTEQARRVVIEEFVRSKIVQKIGNRN